MWFQTDSTGRVVTCTDDERFAVGFTELDAPKGFDPSRLGDYVIRDGVVVYDGAQTEAEKQQEVARQAQDERAQKLEAATQEYFLDGGKETMEQDIRDAAASVAGEAKQAADTAVASVNEYMDALLGLNTTDETEATDAE